MSVYLKSVEMMPLTQPGGLNSATPAFGRFYAGNREFSSTLGYNWTHNYQINLSEYKGDPDYVQIRDWKATELIFAPKEDGLYYGRANVKGASTLSTNASGNFIWQLRHGTQYTFEKVNNNHRLATITDRLGNVLTLTYDNSNPGWLTNVADATGRSVKFVNNGSDLMAQAIDPLNRTNFYLYDEALQLTNVADALGFKAAYTYLGGHLVQSIKDARGNSHSYAYNVGGEVVGATNELGFATRYGIVSGVSVAITNANGNVFSNFFDSSFMVTQAVDAVGVRMFYRDGAGRATNSVDRLGYTNRYVYNEGSCNCLVSGELLMHVDPLNRSNRWSYDSTFHFRTGFTNAAGYITTWSYDSNGNLTNTTDALGNVTKFVVDGYGNTTSVTNALNYAAQYAYDQYGNQTNVIDAMNRTTKFKYDILGRLTNRTNALGFGESLFWDARDRVTNRVDALGRSTWTAYDANGNTVGVTNALGYVTLYSHDAANQLSSVTLPGDSNPFTTYAYDGNGNRVGVTNALGYVTSYGYDALNRNISGTNALGYVFQMAYDAESRMTHSYDALGYTNRFVYDAVGRLVGQTNALGNGTRYAYDLLDRGTGITNALGKVWTFAYDAIGRMTNSTDPDNHKTSFTYDAIGQLRFTTNAENQTVQFQYDLVGNRTNIIDARGNALGFAYDGRNLLTNIIYAAGDIERFKYDPVGNLTNYTARSGNPIRFVYDPANRFTNKTFIGGSDVMTFGYDAADRLTNALWKASSTTNSHVTFQYDPAGRLTNETQKVYGSTNNRSIRYEYDAAGRKTKMTYPDSTFVTYEYNANGWLTNILDGGTNSIVFYTYDNGGRRTKRTLENSTFTVYDYDAADQMTSIAHKKNDLSVISSYEYGYDDAGQRTYVKRANGKGDVYKYDAIDQLTNVLYEATNPDTTPSGGTNDVRYLYDAAGNRSSVITSNSAGQSSVSYVATDLNQYDQVGDTYPGYDSDGNMLYDGVLWHYGYDRENRMTIADIDEVATVLYRYDAFNRLVARVKDGSSATRFYYDDWWRVIAEYDENDSLKAKYVYGPEIDEPVRMTRGGTNCYYHAAALGTVTEITSTNGTLLEAYRYDVYGEPQMWDGSGNAIGSSAIDNRLLFQGRDRDPDTGLYNFRNRYYSPALGRFVQTDPILVIGRCNLYTFAANDPVGRMDPNGDLASAASRIGTEVIRRVAPRAAGAAAGGPIGAAILTGTILVVLIEVGTDILYPDPGPDPLPLPSRPPKTKPPTCPFWPQKTEQCPKDVDEIRPDGTRHCEFWCRESGVRINRYDADCDQSSITYTPMPFPP